MKYTNSCAMTVIFSYAQKNSRTFLGLEIIVDVSSIYSIIFLPKNKQDGGGSKEFKTNVTKLGILKVVQKRSIKKVVRTSISNSKSNMSNRHFLQRL